MTAAQLIKSFTPSVIPAKAGIQLAGAVLATLDPGLRRGDEVNCRGDEV